MGDYMGDYMVPMTPCKTFNLKDALSPDYISPSPGQRYMYLDGVPYLLPNTAPRTPAGTPPKPPTPSTLTRNIPKMGREEGVARSIVFRTPTMAPTKSPGKGQTIIRRFDDDYSSDEYD